MDREEVTEFLGQVPLLQCLPSSSIRRIADAVLVKRYEPGGYVAREGDPVDGLYIILDGQAEVSAPANTEEENRPDYVLNKYDYFGYGKNYHYMTSDFYSSSFFFIKYINHFL
jgi:acyl-coenzyme A thioesterase 1/2/4